MNIISRRSFLERTALSGAAMGVAALANVPMVMKRALASSIGQGSFAGKKVLFIWLRFGNDALNSLVPIGDDNYRIARTPGGVADTSNTALAIPKDPGATASDYTSSSGYIGGSNNFEDGSNYLSSPATDLASAQANGTFKYLWAIPNRDGFSALNPALKFLAPVYNSGNLAVIHRVAYLNQSRSHFDSQNYWENGLPGNNLLREGMFYRVINQSGLAAAPISQAITGVTIQSALPLIMQGDKVALTNLSDPTRFQDGFQGVPLASDAKGTTAITAANGYKFPSKSYRDLLSLQYKNLTDTLNLFGTLPFTDNRNVFTDNVATDGDSDFYGSAISNGNFPGGTKPSNQGYYLFPHNNYMNGGWYRPGGQTIGGRYVIQQNGTSGAGHYGNMKNLKAACVVLNYTDAMIAGTEIGGFDTHNNEIPGNATKFSGSHWDLQRWIGWSIYSCYKFFKIYGKQENGSQPTFGPAGTMPTAKAKWSDVVVVTLSEFGRTSIQNTTLGTDHAEALAVWVAGGAVKGLNTADTSSSGRKGIFCCNTDNTKANPNGSANVAWVPNGALNLTTGLGTGTLFGASQRYLQRAVDYRSIFGEIIRKHLGADSGVAGGYEIKYIIPGYATASEKLDVGGVCPDGITTAGELGLL